MRKKGAIHFMSRSRDSLRDLVRTYLRHRHTILFYTLPFYPTGCSGPQRLAAERNLA
jgi:hypothetical protein